MELYALLEGRLATLPVTKESWARVTRALIESRRSRHLPFLLDVGAWAPVGVPAFVAEDCYRNWLNRNRHLEN